MDELRGLSKTITQSTRNAEALQDAIDYDPDEMPKMHLVPCRWQRTGWKYVEADPGTQNFFNNPNRVNSFGISPKEGNKNMGHQRGRSMGSSFFNKRSSVHKPQFHGETTYGRFFHEGSQ